MLSRSLIRSDRAAVPPPRCMIVGRVLSLCVGEADLRVRSFRCRIRSLNAEYAVVEEVGARAGIARPFKTRYRTARTTLLASSRQRLELIKTVADAEHVVLSTRIAALILLLYGTPVSKICELTLDDVSTTPARTTISVGELPAPIPEALLPLFHEHLAQRGNHQ